MIKPGVRLTHLQPQMILAYIIILEIHREMGFAEPDLYTVVTSGEDSHHGVNSLHPSGNALDFRSKHITSPQTLSWVRQIRARLGDEYDVILEDEGTENAHLHVEYDPK